MSSLTFALGRHEEALRRRLAQWRDDNVAHRLWAKDPALWASAGTPELTNRLGWLHLPALMKLQCEQLTTFAEEVRDSGIRRVVLLGMGGSSLAPEVYQKTFGNAAGYPELEVVDTTHPDAVAAVAARLDLDSTLFVVSSKSGTTVETDSLFRFFWDRTAGTTSQPGSHFVAITDPGTALAETARQRDFCQVFGAPPEVGGRYSALSVFGLVPAALIGVSVEQLLAGAHTMAMACAEPEANPGLELGAAVGELAVAGRNKLTFVASPNLASFPAWLEQLIAESTGKDATGVVPVSGEPLAESESYGDDRVFVHLNLAGENDDPTTARLDALQQAGFPVIRCSLDDRLSLGHEMFRWEVAVAAASVVLGVHPFNQPDVELAKQLARKAMASSQTTGEAAATTLEPVTAAQELLRLAAPGDFIAVQAFIAPTAEAFRLVRELQAVLRRRSRLAVTVDFGPRFLHSTGQLHKGGPDSGLFLQLVDRPTAELPVPGTDFSFRQLIAAQSEGDWQALETAGRRVARADLGADAETALAGLVAALDE